ncbi:MAG: YitT family protein [Prevotella sp.]|nr:YitT family protein [Prevotella sp.]MDD7462298.1 YitT family protein [Prevotellaceae bacterium]MDY3365523.1 YitT family protein [Prevotella sp.]MDY3852467.1 YitT family protein [Prevotella sp.]
MNPLNNKTLMREISDYMMIALGMLSYSLGWTIFLLPNNITVGGVAGLSSIIFWWQQIPVQTTYFAVNLILLAIALKVLGLKFCIKTIFGVSMMTLFVALFRNAFPHPTILHDEPFMASIIGSCFCGVGIAFALSNGGSSGGSDIVAAVINKHKDISLGRVILLTDLVIVTLSYLVLHNWELVIYGYVILFITSFVIDQVINSSRRSVQFLILSERYEEICQRIISEPPYRGCTLVEATGYYTGNQMKMVIVVTKRRESALLFRLIDDIDPNAFVTQSAVIGVYGRGFDHFKVKKKAQKKNIPQ